MKKVSLLVFFVFLALRSFCQTVRLDSITYSNGNSIKYSYLSGKVISKASTDPADPLSPFPYVEYYYYNQNDKLSFVKDRYGKTLREFTYAGDNIATEKRYDYSVSPVPVLNVSYTYEYDFNNRLISKTNFDISNSKYEKYKYLYHSSGTIASITLEDYFNFHGQPGTTPEIKDMKRWVFEENSNGQIISSKSEEWSGGGQIYWVSSSQGTEYTYDNTTDKLVSYDLGSFDGFPDPIQIIGTVTLLEEGYTWEPFDGDHVLIKGLEDVTTEHEYELSVFVTGEPIKEVSVFGEKTTYHYTFNGTVGIGTSNENEKGIVFPNPVKEEVFIELEGEYQFKLFDSYGNMVSQSTNVSNLNRGVYFYEVVGESVLERGKLILE